ncbi:MAG: hypothetical protein CL846_08510 [Crocinitomicaceae bacterium]|nr:hypothetical protein [Crocinitomicaceae bacterium]|tara:strand:+ start:6114 stop:6794 length:681 start_codon:yes stop_codon:yes gene_type:complete
MIRLNRYIANSGVCSRRDADKLISSGKIMVNKQVVNSLGVKVGDNDVVEYNGDVLSPQKLIYLLVNKPKNTSALDFINDKSNENLSVLGEMQECFSGLIVLTNDQYLIDRLSNSSARIKQKFILKTEKKIEQKQINKLIQGINLDGIKVCFDDINYGRQEKDNFQLIVTVSFGSVAYIGQAFKKLNNKLINADRIEFGGVIKGDLIRGKSRVLLHKEIGFLKMIKV